MLKPHTNDRTILINRIVKDYINESFDRELPTEYEIVNESSDIIIYRFKTNNGNSYDLELFEDVMNCDYEIDGGTNLMDIVECSDIFGGHYVITCDIAFVPSEINMDDREDHTLYAKETNRGEQFELMSRISFLIKEYIKNNKNTDVFIIGKNTKGMKLKIYEKVFLNIFSENFTKYEGNNPNYRETGSFYFIKK